MAKLPALLLGALTLFGRSALALPTSTEANYVVHEVRSGEVSNKWQRTGRVHRDAVVPIRIGLKQQNLDTGYDRLMDLSHPESPSYGKHLSPDEVHELFAPEPHVVDAIIEWLRGAGVDNRHIAHSDNKGWVAANVLAEDAERLFQTEYFEYEHVRTGHVRIGSDSYALPDHLADHVDYVTPGIKFSAPLRKLRTRRSGEVEPGWQPHGHQRPGAPNWVPMPYGPYQPPPGAYGLPPDLQGCGLNITPPCLRALYQLPQGHINDSVNSMALFEQGDYFAQGDVSLFLQAFAPWVPPTTKPTVISVDGGEAPVPQASELNTGESDLDIDIAIALTYPQSVIVYQVDDQIYAPQEVAKDNTFNTFLDALDGSYCNYTAYGITGNSPGVDPVYPDPAAGGYKGQLQCGVYKPARVISASYGESEGDFAPAYIRRQCNEFMKLSLQGHTILFSSGDYGVGGPPGDPTASGCLSGNGQNQTIFNPEYPVGCPYVTAVGATQLYPNQTVRDPESAMQDDLWRPGRANAFHFFASAGGFSNVFKAPAYQRQALGNWFAKHDPGYPTYVANSNATNVGVDGGKYNRAGRGMPDVSANGAHMAAYLNGTLVHFYGSSLAAPIWGSVVTLLNQQRTLAGKGPIGFINPVLYANPWALNDITNGSNPNCGSAGFKAVEGWDPVTGLGTPNYPRLLKLFMSLP